MKNLINSVGANRPQDGAASVNCPADVRELSSRLHDLGYLEEYDLTRSRKFLSERGPIQTGFFNRESVIEIHDQHSWGTSWLVELITEAGDLYRENFLKPQAGENEEKEKYRATRALITLNDASLPIGGPSPDHRGMQTGLAVTLLLPRKDGTVRRCPETIGSNHPQFDRDAMKAMLQAFTNTKKLKEILFWDDNSAEASGYPIYTGNPICSRHAQVRVKVPDPIGSERPEGMTKANALSDTLQHARLISRFLELGYWWTDQKILVNRHVLKNKQLVREGQRYPSKQVKYDGLQWSIRLFRAILDDQYIVNQASSYESFVDDKFLDWLYAANAPRWMPLPIGTIDVHARFITAIRLVQAIASGQRTTFSTSGSIIPPDDLEAQLQSDEFPKFVPLRVEDAKYVVADVPFNQLARTHTKVPEWTKDLIIKTADLFENDRAANGWAPLTIRHPGASNPNEHGEESGLRLFILVPGSPEDTKSARLALIKRLREAQDSLNIETLSIIHKYEAAPDFNGLEVTDEGNPDIIEVHIRKKKIKVTDPSSVSNKSAIYITPLPKRPTHKSNYQDIEQLPRLALIQNNTKKITAIALQILRPIRFEEKWAFQPLLIEFDFKNEIDPTAPESPFVLSSVTPLSATEKHSFLPSNREDIRSCIETQRGNVKVNSEISCELDLKNFVKTLPFSIGENQPFPMTAARIVFEKDFAWDGNDTTVLNKACHLECEYGFGLLPKPLRIRFALADPNSVMKVSYVSAAEFPQKSSSAAANGNGDVGEAPDFNPTPIETADEEDAPGGFRGLFEGWRLRFPLKNYKLDVPLLGSKVTLSGAFDLLLSNNGAIAVNLHGELTSTLDIALGSSLVRLRAKEEAKFTANLGTLGFDMRIVKLPELELLIDPFEKIKLGAKREAVIANAFTGGSDSLLISIPITVLENGTEEYFIAWRKKTDLQESGPSFSIDLIRKLFDSLKLKSLKVNSGRILSSMSGRLLGDNQKTEVSFDGIDGEPSFQRTQDPNDELKEIWRLTVPILVKISDPDSSDGNKDVFTGDCKLSFDATVTLNRRSFSFDAGSFSCATDNTLIVKEKNGYHKKFGELISLHIPSGSTFKFILNPSGPRLSWDPTPPPGGGDPSVISLRVPASDATNDADLRKKDNKNEDKENRNNLFAFDIDRFDLQSAGLSLHAGVRPNRVLLGGSKEVVFSDSLAVLPSEKASDSKKARIGELEIFNGRLIAGSLRASAKLPYFDNAVGTLGLIITENNTKKLDCLGTFDVTGSEKFEIAALYAQCEVRGLHLETRYEGKNWSSDGTITGNVKFAPPQGKSASDTGPLAELFQGVTVEFENLSLKKIAAGEGTVKLTCPPKSFRFAEILRVDLHGLDVGLGFSGKSSFPDNFKILGDVTLERLPGVNASLTFSGITLIPNAPPQFTVSRIAGDIKTAGGFELQGVLDHIKTPDEVGFAGAFSLLLPSFPRIGGVVKLTRIRTRLDGQFVPSLAVFLEADITVALFAGFFLRRIGAGIGLRQGIVGLIPDGKPLNIRQRVLQFVDRPDGLPEPRNIDSWKAIHPETVSSRLDWMFVASGLITFGNLAPDKPHTFAGGMLLAIDQDLNITLAANAWLFTSPDETRRREFQERPVVRGAIALNVRDQSLFAYFKTIRKPMLGKEAPQLLAKVLENGETSLLLSIDRNGFLLEIGWPWETKYDYSYGPFKGQLRAGFRFGIYRGVLIYGLNFGVDVQLEAANRFDAGPGTLEFSISGKGYLRTQFLGAITRELDVYLRGDISFGATVRVKATLKWSVSVKVCGKRFSKHFSRSAALSLSIQAAMLAAMDRTGAIGYRGSADIAFSIGGYYVSGTAHFSYQEDLIDRVSSRLEALMPKGLRAEPQADQNTVPPPKRVWNYRYCRLPKNRLRITFFPAPGNDYPTPNSDTDRFKITLGDIDEKRFLGIVGSEIQPNKNGKQYLWSEDLDSDVINETEVLAGLTAKEQADIKEERKKNSEIKFSATLKDVLSKSSAERSHFAGNTEFRDDRTRLHGAARADDETFAIGESDVRSPNLPQDSKYDTKVIETMKTAKKLSRRQVITSKVLMRIAVSPETSFQKVNNEDLTKLGLNPADFKTVFQVGSDVWFFQAESKVYFAVRLSSNTNSIAISEGPTLGVADAIFRSWSQHPPIDVEKELDIVLGSLQVANPTPEKKYRLTTYQQHNPLGKTVWEITLTSSDNPEESNNYLFGADANNNLVVEEGGVRPDQQVVEPGMMLHELLEFMRDERLAPKEKPSHGNYNLAPYLRLVLEFDTTDLKDIDNLRFDPVPSLINLSETSLTGMPLEPVVLPVDGQLPEYDLIVENIFQARDRICIAWEFLPEKGPTPDPFEVYKELENYIVTRIVRSGQSLEPKMTMLKPSWLVQSTAELIRPQFQFVDEDVSTILDGELIDYVIEARSTDRVLASSEVTVVRRTVMPLPAVSQALVVQTITVKENKLLQKLTILAVLPEPGPDKEDIQNLVVCYRVVPASTIGSYGFDTPNPIERGYETPVQIGSEIRFPDSSPQRPQPWTTVQRVDAVFTKTIESILPAATAGEDHTARQLRLAVMELPDEAWPSTPQGAALEFFVGFELPRQNQQPLRRSPLTRCRHSVLAEDWELPKPQEADAVKGLAHLGNTVAAIEKLPDQIPKITEILPNRLQNTIFYPTLSNLKDARDTDEELDTPAQQPRVDFFWQHDLSGRSGFDQPRHGNFDPVVGYTLEHFDRLAPEHYDRDGKLRVHQLQRQAIQVLPEEVYRAIPATVLVQGLRTEHDNTATSIDGAIKQRLDQNTGSFTTLPGNWKPFGSNNEVVDQLNGLTVEPNKVYELVSPQETIEWPGGPVWLHHELIEAIRGLKDASGAHRCQLVLSRPLVDRVADAKVDASLVEQFGQRLHRIVVDLDRRLDPYGWYALESVGLSCECHFFDQYNRPIHAEQLRRAFKELRSENITDPDTITDEEKKKQAAAKNSQIEAIRRVGVITFLAEDLQTPLNVVRFFLARELFSSTAITDKAIVQAMVMQTMGKLVEDFWEPSQSAQLFSELTKECNAKLTDKSISKEGTWLEQISRWINELALLFTAKDTKKKFIPWSEFAEDSRHGAETKNSRPPRAVLRLPIDAQGRLHCKFFPGDCWAHRYSFAVRPVHRYDLLRQLAQNLVSLSNEAPPPSPLQMPLRDTPGWTDIDIDRTKPLVPPMLVATPLPSGVQFLALRHPAEFAANATVDNQGRIQFNGQTFHWPQRRISKSLMDWPSKINLGDGGQPNWSEYAKFVKGKVDREKLTVLLNDELIRKPVPGTMTGIYGTDRFVLPDVPAYYLYRTRCTASAGRAIASSPFSAWVQPIVDSDAIIESNAATGSKQSTHRKSQVPRVQKVFRVNWKNQDKVLEVVLCPALLRDLLPEEYRPYWTESELEHSDSIKVRVGFLPDPDMKYLLYFRMDPIVTLELNPPSFQELLPLARVNLDLDTGKPQVVPMMAGVKPETPQFEQIQSGEDTGALLIHLHFKFDEDTDGNRFLDRIEAVQKIPEAKEVDLARLFAVQGIRDGAFSQIMEFSKGL